MSAVRRAAVRTLEFVVRRMRGETRIWGDAMLREMDFVDDDWSAVRWALGGATVLCRQTLIERAKHASTYWSRQNLGLSLNSVVSGMAVAVVVLTLSLIALAGLMRASAFARGEEKVVSGLFVVGIPVAVYVLGAVALWRRRRGLASGILAAAAILVTHGIVHLVSAG
jgi:hypothetical protein